MSLRSARPGQPALRRRINPNRIFLPRSLRDAIPELPTCIGRELELDSLSGRVADIFLLGECVHLELMATETGKLTGKFPVRVSLSVEAARKWAETLAKLADQAESSRN
jgi:hypothetical protein